MKIWNFRGINAALDCVELRIIACGFGVRKMALSDRVRVGSAAAPGWVRGQLGLRVRG